MVYFLTPFLMIYEGRPTVQYSAGFTMTQVQWVRATPSCSSKVKGFVNKHVSTRANLNLGHIYVLKPWCTAQQGQRERGARPVTLLPDSRPARDVWESAVWLPSQQCSTAACAYACCPLQREIIFCQTTCSHFVAPPPPDSQACECFSFRHRFDLLHILHSFIFFSLLTQPQGALRCLFWAFAANVVIQRPFHGVLIINFVTAELVAVNDESSAVSDINKTVSVMSLCGWRYSVYMYSKCSFIIITLLSDRNVCFCV